MFIDATDKAYLSITARAEVRRDHAKTAQIWTTTDNMWWNGPDDPNACVLRVVPLTAELWDGPASKPAAVFLLVKSLLTGEKPKLGENRKVTVSMGSEVGISVTAPSCPSVKLVQGWVSSPTTLAWRHDRLYLIFP